MIKAYFNYPRNKQPGIMVHKDHNHNCSAIRLHGKLNQRCYNININNISAELSKIKNKTNDYKFDSNSKNERDMWVELDLGNEDVEWIVLDYMRSILGQRYKKFQGNLEDHGC